VKGLTSTLLISIVGGFIIAIGFLVSNFIVVDVIDFALDLIGGAGYDSFCVSEVCN